MASPLPLNALRAFAAAARHASFSLAAQELHVTPGAVSRQIRLLEEHLGQPLFERLPQAVQLTATGRTLAAEVNRHLEGLAAAVARARQANATLTISAPPTFAQEWLLPRLETFQREYPDSEVFLDVSSAIVALDQPNAGIQAALRYGRGDWRDGEVRLLLREWLFPVCSPALIAPATRLEDAAALLDYPLLHAEWPGVWRAGRPQSGSRVWAQWFADQGVAVPRALTGPRFSLSGIALQQAVAGKGIALGGCVLAERLLRSGELIRPLPDRFNRLAPQAYYLVLPKGPVSPAIARWVAWLDEQIRAFREEQYRRDPGLAPPD